MRTTLEVDQLSAWHRLSVASVVMVVSLIGWSSRSEAATVTCAGGDTPCLVAAIGAANNSARHNTIVLGAGTYTLTAIDNTGFFGPNGLPWIAGTLTIKGDSAKTTIIERDASAPKFRVFEVGGDLTLENVTVRGGLTDDFLGGGGGILGGTLTLRGCIVEGNRAHDGGGIHGGDKTTIVNSSVLDNSALVEGGGVYVSAGNQLVILNSTIAGNRAMFGGGVAATFNAR